MMSSRSTPWSSLNTVGGLQTRATIPRMDDVGGDDNAPFEVSSYFRSTSHSDVRRQAPQEQIRIPVNKLPPDFGRYAAINISKIEKDEHNGSQTRKPSFRRNRAANLWTLWKWELLSLLVSATSFIAIVVTLRVYQDRTLSSWTIPISINAIVAILSAAFKGSLGLPISEGISQLKWLWFSETPRQLTDIDLYDKASRGPWGSFLFISSQFVRPQRSYLASLGAIIAVVTLATDPFSQATVSLQSCLRPYLSSPASIPKATTYSASGIKTGPLSFSLDGPMQIAVYLGLVQPPANSSRSVEITCTSGNCTFPADDGASFTTLTMCHACKDITGTVIQDKNESMPSYSLPSGIRVRTSTIFNTTTVNNGWEQPSHPNGPWFRTSMLDIQGLSMVNTDANCDVNNTRFCDLKPFAFECSLLPCVKTYAANFSKNIYQEKELSREYLHYVTTNVSGYFQLAMDRTLYNGTWRKCQSTEAKSDETTAEVLLPDAQFLNGSKRPEQYSSVWYPAECVYDIRGAAMIGIRGFVQDLFWYENLQFDISTAAIVGQFWLQSLWKRGKMNMTSVNSDIAGLATAIGGQMRKNADGPDDLRFTKGETLLTETCIRVQWGFLAFPATLLGLELLFFGAVVIANYRNSWNSDWKSSSLALVFQNLGNPDRRSEEDEICESEQNLYEVAKAMQVKFAEVQGRWRLSRDGCG